MSGKRSVEGIIYEIESVEEIRSRPLALVPTACISLGTFMIAIWLVMAVTHPRADTGQPTRTTLAYRAASTTHIRKLQATPTEDESVLILKPRSLPYFDTLVFMYGDSASRYHWFYKCPMGDAARRNTPRAKRIILPHYEAQQRGAHPCRQCWSRHLRITSRIHQH